MLAEVNWARILLPDTPVLEILVRGTIMYIGLFFLLRIVLKRQSGSLGISDLLVVVLIADAAQNAMAGTYQSIADGLLLVATIIFWSYAFDWLGYYFPAVQRFLWPPPLLLIRDGVLQYRNLRRELLTRDELLSQLREQGIEDIAGVKQAHMEPDGRISVIPCEPKTAGGPVGGPPGGG